MFAPMFARVPLDPLRKADEGIGCGPAVRPGVRPTSVSLSLLAGLLIRRKYRQFSQS